MNVLTLCGSLRSASSNRALLRAYQRLAPPDWHVGEYDGLGALPHFNPDLDRDPLPAEAARLRRLVQEAQLLVVSTPEYAHALPGAFKNALDWLVGDPAFAGHLVVILHFARDSTWALDSLREVLRTMSVRRCEAADVVLPFTSSRLDEEAILARADWCTQLRQSQTCAAKA